MQQNFWQIWIDTGGTFTDCIAIDLHGHTHKIKVLSNSTLRGNCLQMLNNQSIKFEANWPIAKDIFKGYLFYPLDTPEKKITISAIDFDQQVIHFNENINGIAGGFAITANEEAPVLAARLITQASLNNPLPPLQMKLGSTRGTNALLERKGADCALLITRGMKDLIQIGSQQRPDIFNLNIKKPDMLYTSVWEVEERTNAEGVIIQPLQESQVRKIIKEIKQAGIKSIAIVLMHSYKNTEHEKQIAKIAQNEGIQFISVSHQIAPAIKIFPRASTTVVNAYLAPVIETYLNQIKSKIIEGSVKVMSSAGGLFDSNFFTPKDSLLSGPAGGVNGAVAIAKAAGYQRVISFDMGGTSTDVARYTEGFDYAYETKVGDAVLMSPCLAIETVAAGGGSVCHFDGHKITVGPDSAGAWPGPASYGAGGPLSITDVNLMLGRLDEEEFAFPLSKEKAWEAFQRLYPHQENWEQTLTGFLQIANEKMAGAVRKISINAGFESKDHALVSFGGAGGQHACDVAELLDINTVIFPLDASLLSAYGIGIAQVERISQNQILQPLDKVQKEMASYLEKTSRQATEALANEGIAREDIEIKLISWFIRFAGQDFTIEVTGKENLKEKFKKEYQKIYGHWIEDRAIEVESLKVIAANKTEPLKINKEELETFTPQPDKTTQVFLKKRWQQVPLFNLEKLAAGATIEGPALISSKFSVFLIKNGWRFLVKSDLFTIAEKIEDKISYSVSDDETINLELFINRFKAIASDMGALLQRTAFSVNIKERKDFSTAILNKAGFLIVNAPHIPVHLGSMGVCVRSVLDSISINPGDVIITNHPGFGGSHLPDITLIAGIFTQKNKLIGYVANRAHHAELGGKTPGSMPPNAKALIEEGVIISPSYLLKAGEAQWNNIETVLKTAAYPSRAIAENMADLNAGLAALLYGSNAMLQLVENHSHSQVDHYLQMILDYSSEMMIKVLQKYSGTYEAEEFLDDDSTIKVKIAITANHAIFDFSGTSNVHPGNFNATPAIVNSVIIYVLRLMMKQLAQDSTIDIPLNEGLLKNVEIILPVCFLNPPLDVPADRCPAVVGGNTETSQRLTDTLLKALGLAACSQGTMNNLLFGNDQFGYYETIGGGSGAGSGFNGSDAIHQHMTNTAITDAEIMELRYPVRVNQFLIRKNSGGAGQWQGGNGIIRDLTFLQPVQVSLVSQHRKYAPFGMAGGNPGQTGEQRVIRKDGKEENLQGVDGCLMQAGDRLIVETPGGGGYGKECKN